MCVCGGGARDRVGVRDVGGGEGWSWCEGCGGGGVCVCVG